MPDCFCIKSRIFAKSFFNGSFNGSLFLSISLSVSFIVPPSHGLEKLAVIFSIGFSLIVTPNTPKVFKSNSAGLFPLYCRQSYPNKYLLLINRCVPKSVILLLSALYYHVKSLPSYKAASINETSFTPTVERERLAGVCKSFYFGKVTLSLHFIDDLLSRN